MRILHVADRLSDRGGADLALIGLVDALSDGHEQHLVVGRDDRGGSRSPSARGPSREQHRLSGHDDRVGSRGPSARGPSREPRPAVGRGDGAVGPPCPVTIVPGLDARLRAAVDLDPLMARLRPDLVHVHNVVNPAALEWAVGVDAVVTVQDHRFFCPGRGKWTSDGRVCGDAMGRDVCAGCFDDAAYFESIFELTAQRLESLRRLRVTVLSSYMKRELTQVGVAADRITVVPPVVHGLDVDARSDGPPCVLFAGRVVEAKGIRDAIAAWRRSGSNLPFVVAGTGPLRREVEAAGVEVLGWLDRRRLSAAYRRAAVLVMPSRWQEPFGIVGLEALTLGTPVAAWDSGGVREWHPGGELLVPWGDVDRLAVALRLGPGWEADAPSGFEPERLVRRLEAVYRGCSPRAR